MAERNRMKRFGLGLSEGGEGMREVELGGGGGGGGGREVESREGEKWDSLSPSRPC